MIRPNENALTPASLATDGNQGESARTLGPCEAEHSPQGAQARAEALSAVNVARQHLVRYAQATDTPEASLMDAADWLDLAADCLALAEFSDAIKGALAGDA